MTEFCKDNNLYNILNGRCNEANRKTTCKNVSTIDYFVSSPNMLPLLQTLYVHEFCPLLSDSHNAVSLVMTVFFSREQTTSAEKIKKQPKLWSSDKTDDFINNFDVDRIREPSGRLSEFHNKDGIVHDDMNSFVNSLNSVYVENCITTFGTTAQKSKSYDTNKNAKWFKESCKTARKRFHNAKFRYKLRKTDRGK